MQTLITKGLDRVESPQRSAFAIDRPWFCDGGPLETARQVERQDTEPLPGTVGPILLTGDTFEGETSFELPIDFLVRAAASNHGWLLSGEKSM